MPHYLIPINKCISIVPTRMNLTFAKVFAISSGHIDQLIFVHFLWHHSYRVTDSKFNDLLKKKI